MESDDVKKEQEGPSSIATLQCGHSFCRGCLDRVLLTQDSSGEYFCPHCRKRFRSRPQLTGSSNARSAGEGEVKAEAELSCSSCGGFTVYDVTSTLLCEASLCDLHSKSPEHSVAKLEKCPEHEKLMEYYCLEDACCVCASCYATGPHQGHQIQPLTEASEKKKEELREVLQKMTKQSHKIEGRVQSLQEDLSKTNQKANEITERVTALFRELRAQLEDLERRLLSDISQQAERSSSSITEKIQQLEIKKDEMYKKIQHIEELCQVTDPLTVLQQPEYACDTKEYTWRRESKVSEGGQLSMALVSEKLRTLSEIISEVNAGIYREEAADIILDVDTAHHTLQISNDRKTVFKQQMSQNRPDTPKRFKDCPQVLSTCSVSSGRHCWDLYTAGACNWIVGVCYPSMERRGGPQSLIGNNNKSWALYRHHNQMRVGHDNKYTPLTKMVPSKKVRIDVDYEAGKISFYDLSDLIRHLHTFTATFTEPLHVGLAVWEGCIKTSGLKNDKPHAVVVKEVGR